MWFFPPPLIYASFSFSGLKQDSLDSLSLPPSWLLEVSLSSLFFQSSSKVWLMSFWNITLVIALFLYWLIGWLILCVWFWLPVLGWMKAQTGVQALITCWCISFIKRIMLLSQDQTSSWINLEGALKVLFIHLLSVRVNCVCVYFTDKIQIYKQVNLVYIFGCHKKTRKYKWINIQVRVWGTCCCCCVITHLLFNFLLLMETWSLPIFSHFYLVLSTNVNVSEGGTRG